MQIVGVSCVWCFWQTTYCMRMRDFWFMTDKHTHTHASAWLLAQTHIHLVVRSSFTLTEAFSLHASSATRDLRTYFTSVGRVFLLDGRKDLHFSGLSSLCWLQEYLTLRVSLYKYRSSAKKKTICLHSKLWVIKKRILWIHSNSGLQNKYSLTKV